MQHRDVKSRVLSRIQLSLALIVCTIAPLLAPSVRAESNDILPTLDYQLRSAAGANSQDATLSVQEIGIRPVFARTIDLTEAPDDLWIRIRNGFAMTNLNDDLTLHYQQYYQNRPEALRSMVERSRPLMHHIVEEIEARGMPTELALLPMVESSFNPMAHSPAAASGLWQFIPATGKRFDLEQNWWHDQRRDIVASTGAALDYLQTIYDMHGDWHLALASYNWGEGAVKRAIEKNQARDMPTDYASLTMPNETRHYVPKLQALKNIFGDPVLMARLNLPSISNSPYFSTVTTSQPIDIKTAARLAEMPVDQFVALNPSHNRPIIQADTSLVIPNDKLEAFQSNLESNQSALSNWQTYTPKSSERLDQIAPRFGITLNDLRRINGLHGKLKITSSTLLVPTTNGNADQAALSNLVGQFGTVAPKQAKKTTVNRGIKGKKTSTKDKKIIGKKTAKTKAAVAKPSKTTKSSTKKPAVPAPKGKK
ncbi:MAG: transglycosylase SLT domain-containing protein [Rhodocyclaceae bacterium]|nr:transglycosylase SLT domain-containing protein [Rhodocyclaceae bacterium]